MGVRIHRNAHRWQSMQDLLAYPRRGTLGIPSPFWINEEVLPNLRSPENTTPNETN